MPSDLVESGYDKIAAIYNLRRHTTSNKKELEEFALRLPKGGSVLDVGCGTGYASRFLYRRGFSVTGIDISKRMLEIAKWKVPHATFLRMNMKEMSLEGKLFDGIVCLYSIIHVERKFHRKILADLNHVLKQGGLLLILTGWFDYVGVENNYLKKGVRMKWSYFTKDTNLRMIKESGFTIIWSGKDQKHDGTHLLVLAKKM